MIISDLFHGCYYYLLPPPKGGNYEVPLPRVRWMPGSDEGVANVLGIEAVEHHRFERCAGRYEARVIKAVRARIAWMLELEASKNP